MEQARPGGGSWEPPPGAPNSISRPTAGRQPPRSRSWGVAGVLHSQVAHSPRPFGSTPASVYRGSAVLRSFGGSADRTYCRRAPVCQDRGPTDRGLLEGSQFPRPVAPVAAPEFVASIFPRPVLGKMLVNFQILPRRSCTEARGSVQERLLQGQSLKGHFNP